MSPDRRFYSTREAAQLLGLSLRTVQLWVESGSLPAWKTDGGHRRIPVTSVDRLIAAQNASMVAPDAVLRIVLVENDEHVLNLYHSTLEAMEHPAEVTSARDGYQGLLLIGRTLPDLVIVDLSLSGLDGFRLIRAVREDVHINATQLVVITALDDAAISDRGGLPQDVAVFRKPVPLSSLGSIVNDVLKARAASAQADQASGSTRHEPRQLAIIDGQGASR
jgi:excisionase family DNA binding protein